MKIFLLRKREIIAQSFKEESCVTYGNHFLKIVFFQNGLEYMVFKQ